MSNYNAELKEARRESWPWFWMILAMLIIGGAVLTFTGAGGKFFNKFVERKVLETSHQYVEGNKERVAILNASRAKAQALLSNPNLTAGERANLNANLATIDVQLAAARSK